ncbi:hypothetical protein MtrunA17_Chr3g0096311 [Medicago truncatula]|uniref:Uncharacterized protein n=1 Tax=Medicago truncatula TaxID=3880 RepID=G7IXV5_MEDTR|nr:uncharacterized protein LOC11407149 [Medicago truncatula]AES70083.1 hypothetical protein MTR_3g047590 [Medicago truncatula]RHN66857.1 hypothetical protein MtrunA17_Chr3g0096311 [Medicago truncatula]
MVLISGNNKSVLQQANDGRAKAQGVTVHQNSHQQGNKSVESVRTQNLPNTVLAKGMTTLDEFKYGFPSESLSTISNKWWGWGDSDDRTDTNQDGGKSQPEESGGEAEKKERETGKAESSEETRHGLSLLRSVRKRAVEEGRETFNLGVFRGFGVNKLAKREKILLHQIFGSSLPKSWMDA